MGGVQPQAHAGAKVAESVEPDVVETDSESVGVDVSLDDVIIETDLVPEADDDASDEAESAALEVTDEMASVEEPETAAVEERQMAPAEEPEASPGRPSDSDGVLLRTKRKALPEA